MAVIAVVAYPTLDEADRHWIESIRACRDPQASRVAVHFTLVFPADALPGEVSTEVTAVAGSAKAIPFTIHQAMAVRDSQGGGHVFLVPDEGHDEITDLHDRLYAGILRPHLRTDIPFTPHMTLAPDADVARCAALAEQLNRDSRTVRGALRSVNLVHVGTYRVESIRAFVLGKPGARSL
jgi:2'-5' RNA ligase